MHDQLGNLVEKGCKIGYVVQTRVGPALKFAYVMEVDKDGATVLSPDRKTIHLGHFDRMVVITPASEFVAPEPPKPDEKLIYVIGEITKIRNRWAAVASKADIHIQEHVAAPRIVTVIDGLLQFMNDQK